jgi:membrane protease YdiL (CAAX protease family)
MAAAQRTAGPNVKRGLLARPLEALAFLFPLILFYEVASMIRPNRVIAFDLMQRFFDLFGNAGMWAPGLGVIAILLATHIASGERWRVRWSRVGLMYFEAAALAIPLLALNLAIPLSVADLLGGPLTEAIALGIGAGIYEELVFRLVLISLLTMIGVDLLRLDRTPVAVFAVILSSLAFAAHHHLPIGTEPYSLMPFMFRCIAGGYLAVIFWYRGYGSAAGCHAAYNVALACLEHLS